jgi:hypothetical protein
MKLKKYTNKLTSNIFYKHKIKVKNKHETQYNSNITKITTLSSNITKKLVKKIPNY